MASDQQPASDQSLTFLPSIAFSDINSATSTEWTSDITSKQTSIDLTPDLVLPATPARMVSEYYEHLEPVKFSPPETQEKVAKGKEMVETHTKYNSFAQRNPFADERYTRIEDFYNVQPLRTKIVDPDKPLPKLGHTTRGIPHSQSENNIEFHPSAHHAYNHQMGRVYPPRSEHSGRSSEDTYASSAFSRGRSPRRSTPTPIKALEDIKEVQSPFVPPSPPKRSRSPMKQLFGEHGWLGKSMSMKELPSEEYRKKGVKHLAGKLKDRVEHLTEDMANFIPTKVYQHRSPSKSSTKSKFPVSLGPAYQAKLYADIELMICTTANKYLTIQKDQGRMSVESLKKVTEWWTSKNRPQVIEFMFDQATQRDLVLYNLKTFRFYGPKADNLLSMNTMMQSWKVLAREMNVRTFCTPDSVIRTHMQDCYKIMEMLGAPFGTFLAFQEIQVAALKVMREEQQKRDEHEAIKWGVEKQWEPPARENSFGEMEGNPF